LFKKGIIIPWIGPPLEGQSYRSETRNSTTTIKSFCAFAAAAAPVLRDSDPGGSLPAIIRTDIKLPHWGKSFCLFRDRWNVIWDGSWRHSKHAKQHTHSRTLGWKSYAIPKRLRL
jgi:hypothetical protein